MSHTLVNRYRYGDCDMGNVDHLAVEFACNGTCMQLNRDEITVAAQRMCGKVPAHEIARRCCTTERVVTRILNAVGATTCAECNQLILPDGGVLPRHHDYRYRELCPGSGVVVAAPEFEHAAS